MSCVFMREKASEVLFLCAMSFEFSFNPTHEFDLRKCQRPEEMVLQCRGGIESAVKHNAALIRRLRILCLISLGSWH